MLINLNHMLNMPKTAGGYLALMSMLGCASTSAQTPKTQAPSEPITIHDGELALELGDPARAIRILSQIPKTDPSHPYATELLTSARSQMERIVIQWFNDVDRLVKARKLSVADARLKYIMSSFMLTAEQRIEADIRTAELKLAFAEALRSLGDAEQQAGDYMLQHQPAFAATTLRQVKELAWNVSTDKGLTIERMIAAAELRYRQGVNEGSITATIATKTRFSRSRRRSRRVVKPASPSPIKPAPTPAAVPEVSPRIRRAQEQLKLAQAAHKRRSYFSAIRLYRQVLDNDAGNANAKAALSNLESERQRLVKLNLEKANTFFLRQELTSAKAFYEQVLILEPHNKQALEGMRMYRNLERIRQKRQDGS